MEETEPYHPVVGRPAAANSEETGRKKSDSATLVTAGDSAFSTQMGQADETRRQEAIVPGAAPHGSRFPVTPPVPQTVQDTFKVVKDTERGIELKVVPPYWRVLQTDVKMRWRGRQLLSVLTEEFRSRPVEYYTKALESGECIFVNGAACRGSTVLCNGDRITHRTLETEFALPAAPVLVFYEDAHILAAFKPAGIPVHPQGRYTQGSLLSILKTFHLRSTAEYLHPINRLDRVTAGVVVFAKSPLYARMLTAALPSAVKLYLAEVHGDFRTCVQSVREIQRHRRSTQFLSHPRCDVEEQPQSENFRHELKDITERGEANPMCCCEDEMHVGDASGSDSTSPLKPAKQEKDAKETGEKHPAGTSGNPERVSKRELKRLAKRERRLKRMRNQPPQPEGRQGKIQKHSVNEEERCSDEVEFLDREEATLRGIFKVVPFPGCTLCRTRNEDTGTSTGESTAVTHYRNTGSKEATQDLEERSGSACCCADWLLVSARLQTSSRLVGRQLAVVWNEKCGKDASTFFKHLHYNAETNSSLIACVPRTGRTHQIRKHLQCLGATPIVNDSLYGESRLEVTKKRDIKRQSHAAGVESASFETGREEERTTSEQRASTEREVCASFSVEELQSSIGAVTSDSHEGPAADTRAEDQSQHESSSHDQSGEDFLTKLLQQPGMILDLRVSAAGDSVEIPYIIEEPWEIHLCSLAYGFALDTGGCVSNAVPYSAEEKRQLLAGHGSEEAPLRERSRRLSDGDPPPFESTRTAISTATSPPGTDTSPASAKRNLQRVFVSCPGALWPSWAKPVTHLINDKVWSFLQCVET